MKKYINKTPFVNDIWICCLSEDLQEIIGRTIILNYKEMISYVKEDGTNGIISYRSVQNIYQIAPNFKKGINQKLTTKESNALSDILKDLDINFNKN